MYCHQLFEVVARETLNFSTCRLFDELRSILTFQIRMEDVHRREKIDLSSYVLTSSDRARCKTISGAV